MRVTRPGLLRRLRIGIQDQLVVSLLFIGVVPVIVMAVLGHWVMKRAATTSAGFHLQSVAERVAQDLDLGIRDLTQVAHDLGARSESVRNITARADAAYAALSDDGVAARVRLARMDWLADSVTVSRRLMDTRLSSELSGLRELDPLAYNRVMVTDRTGLVIGSSDPPGRNYYGDEPWWLTAWNDGEGATYISKLYYSEGQYLLNIAAPVFSRERDRVLGVVRVLAEVTDMLEVVENTEVGQTGFATLISTYGDVLISPLPRPFYTDVLTGNRLRRLNTGYPEWFEDRGLLRGTNAVVALAPVPSTRSQRRASFGGAGWTVSVEQTNAEILGATHQFGRTSVFIILFATAVVMVFGLVLSNRILRPLRGLRDGARRIGAGELDLRLDVRTRDEIQELATEFNTMAGRLKQSYEGLEQKIRDATAELAREKGSLEAILAALGEGLMVVDIRHRIVMWNRAIEKMTGYAAEEAVGRRCSEVLNTRSEGTEDFCSSACPVRNGIEELKTVTHQDMTTYVRTRDDRQVPVAFTASPLLDEDQQPIGCVVVVRDITREKEIDRLKSSMISTVSHELRAPLTPIIGFADMLLDPKLPEEKRRQFAGIIAREGRRLERLVQDFLTLSRIEAGRFELELSEVDARAVAEEIVRLESEHLEKHALDNALPESFPPIVADRERLKRVLHNLVSNAVKYSPDGGKVTITGRARDAEVDISVSDEGIGIRDQDIERLFKRFERVNREATPNVSGTGLGLSICANIVRKHGGSISVESEYGKGSTFTVTLPVSGPPADLSD